MRELPSDLPVADPEAPAQRGLARSLPRWVALPAAAALIAIVALGSRSPSIAPAPVAIDTSPAITAVEVVVYVALALGSVLLVPAIAIFLSERRRRRRAGNLRFPRELPLIPVWARALGLILTLTVVVAQAVVVLAYLAELRRAAGDGPATGLLETIAGLGRNALVPPDPDVRSLTIAFAVVTALAILLVALAVKWRLEDSRLPAVGAGDLDVTTAQAVEMSLDALRREPDPRRAVIAAYAAMERSLSGAGLGRRHSEAPMEYLRRVLAGSTSAADEARTITHLFQVAKFSHHAVDETMRSGAIHALERIRSATRAPG